MFKILLVIDLQTQFKDLAGNYNRCLTYINENRDNYNYIIGTYFKNSENSQYYKQLEYSDWLDSNENDLEFKCDKVICKPGYSISSAIAIFHDFLLNIKLSRFPINPITKKQTGLEDIRVDLMGYGSDTNILATAFSLWDYKLNFRVLTDYIYSLKNDIPKNTIISLYKSQFGKCVI